MAKLNLFGNPKKLEFAAVGTADTGIIYLLKRDRLKVKENPMELQARDRKQAEMIALIGAASKRLATERGISDPDEAQRLFFARIVDGVEVMPSARLTDYLDFNETAKYFEINASASSKYKVATLFIKYRLGYHVTISESSKAKSADLEVEPLRWSLAIGDTIQFDGFRVEITEAANIGDERIYIKPLPQKLDRGATGFLIDFESNSLKVGMPSWSEDETQELDEIQVDSIYEFYQQQIGLRQSEDGGKSQTETLKDSSNQNQLTGSTATPESNGTESATRNSQSKDLETVTAI